MPSRWLILLAALATTACDPDTAVFVEATLSNGSLALQTSSLGVGIGGSFAATLRLGERASGPSDVELRGFSLASADRTRTFVDNLQATTDIAFPVAVGVDDTVDLSFSLDPNDNFGEASLQDDLCPGPLVIVGLFEGSLRGGSIDVATEAITPTGCP